MHPLPLLRTALPSFYLLGDDLLAAVLIWLPSAQDLGVTAMVSARLRRACAAEAEVRCRARIERGWDYAAWPPTEPPAAWALSRWHLDPDLHEMVSFAADCAGGWSRLLAGREGFLDTHVIIPFDRDLALNAQSGIERLPLAHIACFCVLWEVGTREDGVTWSGILPLAHWLHDRPTGCVAVRPSGGPLLGGERPHGNGYSLLSGPLNDARSRWVRASIVGPGFGEVALRTFGIEPSQIALLRPHGPGLMHFGPTTHGRTDANRWLNSAYLHLSTSVDRRGDSWDATFTRFYTDHAADACEAVVWGRESPVSLLPPDPLGVERSRAPEHLETSPVDAHSADSVDADTTDFVGLFTYSLDLHVTSPSLCPSVLARAPEYHVDIALFVHGGWQVALSLIVELSAGILAGRKTVNGGTRHVRS